MFVYKEVIEVEEVTVEEFLVTLRCCLVGEEELLGKSGKCEDGRGMSRVWQKKEKWGECLTVGSIWGYSETSTRRRQGKFWIVLEDKRKGTLSVI